MSKWFTIPQPKQRSLRISRTTPWSRSTQIYRVGSQCPRLSVVTAPTGGFVQREVGERLYFVVETKSSLFRDDLGDKERAKIECGKAHFHALRVSESPAEYAVAHSVDDVLTHLSGD
jgi:hypothetical protein